MGQSESTEKSSVTDAQSIVSDDGNSPVVDTASTDQLSSQDGIIKKKDLEYLIGNLEKFPASARKLFAMGRLYLLSGATEEKGDQGFKSLFTPLTTAVHEGGGRVDDVSQDPASSSPPASPLPVNQLACGTSLFIPLKKSAPLHNAQTFIQWKAAHSVTNFYSLCLPKSTTIYLQPIDDFPEFVTAFRLQMPNFSLSFFEVLQGFAQIFFSGLEVFVSPAVSMSDMRWRVSHRKHVVTGQKQFCVDDLYPLLRQILPSDGLCSVGILWTDIYPEGYNFVLGEASKKHQSAVLSFGRFETKCFDPDTHKDVTKISGQILWKLLKSLSHEVCHLLGLHHCKFFHCAMNESNSVDEAMSQPLFLCPVCLRKLQQVCQFDILERYQQLHHFLSSVHSQMADCDRLQVALDWLNLCIEYLNS